MEKRTPGEKVGPVSFSKAIYYDRVGPLINFPALTPDELIALDEKEKTKVRNKSLQFISYPNAANAFPKGSDAVWQKQPENLQHRLRPIVYS